MYGKGSYNSDWRLPLEFSNPGSRVGTDEIPQAFIQLGLEILQGWRL